MTTNAFITEDEALQQQHVTVEQLTVAVKQACRETGLEIGGLLVTPWGYPIIPRLPAGTPERLNIIPKRLSLLWCCHPLIWFDRETRSRLPDETDGEYVIRLWLELLDRNLITSEGQARDWLSSEGYDIRDKDTVERIRDYQSGAIDAELQALICKPKPGRKSPAWARPEATRRAAKHLEIETRLTAQTTGVQREEFTQQLAAVRKTKTFLTGIRNETKTFEQNKESTDNRRTYVDTVVRFCEEAVIAEQRLAWCAYAAIPLRASTRWADQNMPEWEPAAKQKQASVERITNALYPDLSGHVVASVTTEVWAAVTGWMQELEQSTGSWEEQMPVLFPAGGVHAPQCGTSGMPSRARDPLLLTNQLRRKPFPN